MLRLRVACARLLGALPEMQRHPAARMRLCVDWDGVLVDSRTQQWLPGAQDGLHDLVEAMACEVIIHTARANYPEGHAQVRGKLNETGLAHLEIRAKPLADMYIDDRAHRFTGDWPGLIMQLEQVPRKPSRRAGIVNAPRWWA